MTMPTHGEFLSHFHLPPDPCPARLVALGGCWQVATRSADRRFSLVREEHAICPACGAAFVVSRGRVAIIPIKPRTRRKPE